jgi:resuscitation-promoting factor RpfA
MPAGALIRVFASGSVAVPGRVDRLPTSIRLRLRVRVCLPDGTRGDNRAVRALLPVALVAALAVAASGSALTWRPSAAWLTQAWCIHTREGPWSANTGNGYFGGMQFAPQTWKRVGGRSDPSFAHPGDSAFPFAVSPGEQLYRAWLLWPHDGGSWRSWGAVGVTCAQSKVTRVVPTLSHA